LSRAAVRPIQAHIIGIGANEGRCRFFEIEALTVLALIVLHYRIEVLEEPQFMHETLEQRRERVLEAHSGLTLTPARVPLQLIKRK
jgi:hypothetical protein